MEEFKVPHPENDETWVIFNNPTPRQKEILVEYQKLLELKNKKNGKSFSKRGS